MNVYRLETAMPKHGPSCSNHASGWQMLTEFLIPCTSDADDQAMEQIVTLLQNLGLEPAQVQRIQALIDQSLLSLDGIYAPLRIRLSVSGDVFASLPEAGIENQPVDPGERCCLSFFVVKRIVDQLPKAESQSYRLVEVLIYGE